MSRNFARQGSQWHPLYKYHSLNEYLIKMISEERFFLQHPSNFNDPNEFEVLIKDLAPEVYETYSTAIIDDISTFMADTFIRHSEAADKDKIGIETTLRKLMSSDVKNGLAIVNLELKEYIEKYFNYNLDEWRATCFSQEPKNQLMWSHYANGMTGVCLGFLLTGFGFEGLTQVDYPLNNQKPKIDIWEACRENNLSKTLPLKTKHKSWSYEKEWRIIEKSKYHYFRPKDLRDVYLGYKANPDDAFELLSLFKSDTNYRHVRFHVAFPTPEIYGIEHLTLSKEPKKAKDELTHINSISRNTAEINRLLKDKSEAFNNDSKNTSHGARL